MEDFREIWNSYYTKLMLYSSSFSGLTASDREDCLQEIFLTLHDKLESYDSRWALSTWIYRIARNKLIDCQRSRRKGGDKKSLDTVGEIPGQPQTDNFIDLRLDLETAIAGMKDRDRELLHLYYYEEYSVGEIAEVLGIPRGTVKSRLHRVRRILKDELEEVYVAQ